MIQIKLTDNEFDKLTGKPTFYFKLKEWIWCSEFKDGKLVLLAAKDTAGVVRFKFDNRKK